MKIAFHINTISKGGAERAVINLAEYFSKKGNDVSIITSKVCDSEYRVSHGVRRINLSETYNNSSYYRYITLTKKLRTVVLKEKYDIIIPFISGSIFRAFFATLFTKIKVVGSVRNDPNYEYAGFMGKVMSTLIMPKLDGCVFQTTDAMEWFPRTLQEKSVVIFNSIKPIFYNVQRSPVRYSVVTFGRLAPQKNQSLLVKAFADVHKIVPEASLSIYGTGILQDKLQQLIEDLNARVYIKLMGETSNVQEILATADIFVLPSDFEGMPNALMEAMAVGVPCVSTNCPCGGPKNLLDNGEGGILVNPGNQSELSSAIVELLLDEDRKIRYSKKGIEKSLTLTEDIIGNTWLKYIKKIVLGCNNE